MKQINPNLIKLAEQTCNPELEIDESVFEETKEPIQLKANISLQDFIQTDITGINGNKTAISKFEFPGLNNLKWEDTHFKLNENGLYMPTPEIFMQYFRNYSPRLGKRGTGMFCRRQVVPVPFFPTRRQKNLAHNEKEKFWHRRRGRNFS